MTRHAALVVAVGFLLTGCATSAQTYSQSSASSVDIDWLITAPPTLVSHLTALDARRRGQAQHSASMPVNLTFTSDTVNKINLQWLRDTTLAVIAEQVPNARNPMTINVKLNVKRDVISRFQWMPSVSSALSFEDTTSEQITAYRVVYTISDAAGQVVESNQLTLDNGQLVDAKAGALKPRYGLVGDTAMFLASRVKTLDQ